MLAIEVHFNGERLGLAGARDLSVLSGHVTAVGLLGPETVEFRKGEQGAPQIDLRVGGLTSRRSPPDEHLAWFEKLDVNPGDTVTFRVLEVQEADAPRGFKTAKARTPGADERAYFRHLKKEYLRLAKKYEKHEAKPASKTARRKRRTSKRRHRA
jgi:hypothetical protein